MITTRSPAAASVRARFAAVDDFPSWGPVLVISTIFRSRFLLEKMMLVRND